MRAGLNSRAVSGVLGVASLLLAALPATAQTTRYLFVSDENNNTLARYNGATGAPAGGNYPAPLNGAEGVFAYNNWVVGTAHKAGGVATNPTGLYVFDQNNGASSRQLFSTSSTGLAGIAFNPVTQIAYVTDENSNTLSRYQLTGLGGTNINAISATLLNSVVLGTAHDVLFYNNEVYATAGASAFKGVKKYSNDLSTVVDFIDQAAAIAAGYNTSNSRTTGMAFSPDGSTFFLAHANIFTTPSDNFIGRFSASGTFLGSGLNIVNPTAGPNASELQGVLGMVFENEDLYVTPYNSRDAVGGAKVTKIDFNPGANYQADTPTLSAFVSNAGGPQGSKYLVFVNSAAAVPEPGEWAVMGMGALSIGGLMVRARRKRSL